MSMKIFIVLLALSVTIAYGVVPTPQDEGVFDCLGCVGSAIGTGVACTVGEVVTVGTDTAVCIGGGFATTAACASCFGE